VSDEIIAQVVLTMCTACASSYTVLKCYQASLMKKLSRPAAITHVHSQDAKGPQVAEVRTATTPPKLPTSNIRKLEAATSSLDIFNHCIDRAKNLVKIHEAAHGKKRAKPERYLADSHRAAIVLAISALDAFIRSFVITQIRILLANRATALPDGLAGRIKGFLKEDGLLEAARKDDLLERVEKAFRDNFEKSSFQGTRQISESLKLVGYDDIFHSVAISAGENEDTLRSRLDEFTDRRHGIAHRGDYDLSQNPPRERAVTKKDAEECIKIVSIIAKHIDEIGQKQ
jgi:hypothetical protein